MQRRNTIDTVHNLNWLTDSFEKTKDIKRSQCKPPIDSFWSLVLWIMIIIFILYNRGFSGFVTNWQYIPMHGTGGSADRKKYVIDFFKYRWLPWFPDLTILNLHIIKTLSTSHSQLLTWPLLVWGPLVAWKHYRLNFRRLPSPVLDPLRGFNSGGCFPEHWLVTRSTVSLISYFDCRMEGR